MSARGTVLIIEDEFLISLDMSEMLTLIGYDCHIESTIEGALAYLERASPRFAFLDHQIHDRFTDSVAAQLMRRGVPFCVCSGANVDELEEVFNAIPFLAKPYSQRSVEEVIGRLDRAPVH